MFPDQRIVRAYALRSVGLWFVFRAAMALVLANAQLRPFPRSIAAAAMFTIVTVTLCVAELWRRRERALVANLGVSLPQVLLISATLPALLEAFLVATAAHWP